MSHQIFEDDVAEYATDAWHGLGHVHGRPFLPNEVVSPWPQFERVPTYIWVDDGKRTPGVVPTGNDAIVRVDDVTKILNPNVTGRFGLPDLNWIDDFAAAAFEQGYISGFQTRGTLDHGQRAYASLKLSEDIVVGNELLHSFVTLYDGVQGTGAGARNTVERVVCSNTWAAYLIGSPVLFSERHTTNFQARIDMGWKALLATWEAKAELGREIERWANEVYTEAQFNGLVNQLVPIDPVKDSKRSVGMATTKRKGLQKRYHAADLDTGVRETKFGALMAVQGWEQWEAPVRGADQQYRHTEALVFGKQSLTEEAAALLAAN